MRQAAPTCGGDIRIGISGWAYAGWRGVFYPRGLPPRRELAYAAARFRAIEVNATFYRLQRPEHFRAWHDASPPDTVFALKGPRYITHLLKLRNAQIPIANFFASGVLALGPKLGPILWQFPARDRYDPARFEAFLEALPRDTCAAARLAAGHDARLEGRRFLDPGPVPRPIRHAIEIRHESFAQPGFLDLLRRHDAALVVSDAAVWTPLMDVTASLIYCRLHGADELYASGYEEDAIALWAARVRAWAAGGEPADALRCGPAASPSGTGRDVFVFFDNDAKVRAPADAQALARVLGVEREDGAGGDASGTISC